MSEYIRTMNHADRVSKLYREGKIDPQGLELELISLGFFDIKIEAKVVQAKFIGVAMFLGEV